MKMKNFIWKDSRGKAHGHWCREKLYKTTCKFCGKEAWYYSCSHGSKVFFHSVPWEGGHWDSFCPARNNTRREHDRIINKPVEKRIPENRPVFTEERNRYFHDIQRLPTYSRREPCAGCGAFDSCYCK